MLPALVGAVIEDHRIASLEFNCMFCTIRIIPPLRNGCTQIQDHCDLIRTEPISLHGVARLSFRRRGFPCAAPRWIQVDLYTVEPVHDA